MMEQSGLGLASYLHSSSLTFGVGWGRVVRKQGFAGVLRAGVEITRRRDGAGVSGTSSLYAFIQRRVESWETPSPTKELS